MFKTARNRAISAFSLLIAPPLPGVLAPFAPQTSNARPGFAAPRFSARRCFSVFCGCFFPSFFGFCNPFISSVFAADDGLGRYRRLVEAAGQHLAHDGVLVFSSTASPSLRPAPSCGRCASRPGADGGDCGNVPLPAEIRRSGGLIGSSYPPARLEFAHLSPAEDQAGHHVAVARRAFEPFARHVLGAVETPDRTAEGVTGRRSARSRRGTTAALPSTWVRPGGHVWSSHSTTTVAFGRVGPGTYSPR